MIILLSDDNSDSETSEISSEPAMSYNKASPFPAENNYDNEETFLKKNMMSMVQHGFFFKNISSL